MVHTNGRSSFADDAVTCLTWCCVVVVVVVLMLWCFLDSPLRCSHARTLFFVEGRSGLGCGTLLCWWAAGEAGGRRVCGACAGEVAVVVLLVVVVVLDAVGGDCAVAVVGDD